MTFLLLRKWDQLLLMRSFYMFWSPLTTAKWEVIYSGCDCEFCTGAIVEKLMESQSKQCLSGQVTQTKLCESVL